nr:hypothetical protein [Lunatibacter salilacus]
MGTHTADQTLLSDTIPRIKAAQGSKAPIQKTVDKITGYFVPIVLAVAFLSGNIWSISGVQDAYLMGMLATITVLVITCPCALGLATPTAIMVGMGKAASMGILVKDAESLETGKKLTPWYWIRPEPLLKENQSCTRLSGLNTIQAGSLEAFLPELSQRASIAMAHGTDIAMEVAKVTLMHSNLTEIPQLLRL